MLDLRRLRLLRELAARGTIGAVALALDYSPSAVSQQLAQLEKEAGRAAARARRAQRAADGGGADARRPHRRAARARRGGRGRPAGDRRADHRHRARRGDPVRRASTCSRPRCGSSRAEHPALRVEVTDAEPETSMPSARARHARHGPRPTSTRSSRARRTTRLDLEPLLEEQFHIVLPAEPPAGGDGGPVALAALRDEPWAIGKDDSAYAELTIRACRALGGFEPDVRHRSNDLLMLLALVANGQAVTLLPDLVRRRPRAVGRHPRRRRGAADPHRVRRDPPRQRAAAGAQRAASSAAGYGGWPSVGSHARTRKPPGARAAVSPPPSAAASSATSSSARAASRRGRPARPARRACTRSRRSPRSPCARRPARHAPRGRRRGPTTCGTRRGSPARSSATGMRRRAISVSYLVQAGHSGRGSTPHL